VKSLLLNLLNKKTIKIDDEITNWKEAAKISGQLLVNTGKVEKRYIDAMIKSVEKYGPYIVIAPRIALFHARPEDGVKSMCMSLTVFKKGIIFNVPDKDPVKLVFVLGAIDNESHLKMLSDTMVLLQDEEVVNNIISSEEVDEIIQIIKNKLIT